MRGSEGMGVGESGGVAPSVYRITAVGVRVIRQLKRDRRTIGLITFAPIFLMVLFGYALSGEMSGIGLGLVEEASEDEAMGEIAMYLQGVDDFTILHLASEADAERLIADGRLDGAVVLTPAGVKVLLDATSPQVSSTIVSEVQAGFRRHQLHPARQYPRSPLLSTMYMGMISM